MPVTSKLSNEVATALLPPKKSSANREDLIDVLLSSPANLSASSVI